MRGREFELAALAADWQIEAMSTQTEYEILAVAFEDDRPLAHEGLKSVVQKYLSAGWEPLGAPFLNADMIYQAVVRRPQANPGPSLAESQQPKPTAEEKKKFSERFSSDDWLTLCGHKSFVEALGRSVRDAELEALRLLC